MIDSLVDFVNKAFRGETSRKGWTTEADLLDGIRIDSEGMRVLIEDAASWVVVARVARSVGSPQADIAGRLQNSAPIVGCYHLKCNAPGSYYIGMISVDPERQGQGIGKLLIEDAERRVRDAKASELRMTVIEKRTELVQFYERRGYLRTGLKIPFEVGCGHYGIQKQGPLVLVELAKIFN